MAALNVVEVAITQPIRTALKVVLEHRVEVTADEVKKLRGYPKDLLIYFYCWNINYLLPGRYDNEAAATVPYKTLNILSKSLQRLHSNNKIPAGSPIWVHELMKGTKIIVPSIPEKIEVCLFLPQY